MIYFAENFIFKKPLTTPRPVPSPGKVGGVVVLCKVGCITGGEVYGPYLKSCRTSVPLALTITEYSRLGTIAGACFVTLALCTYS